MRRRFGPRQGLAHQIARVPSFTRTACVESHAGLAAERYGAAAVRTSHDGGMRQARTGADHQNRKSRDRNRYAACRVHEHDRVILLLDPNMFHVQKRQPVREARQEVQVGRTHGQGRARDNRPNPYAFAGPMPFARAARASSGSAISSHPSYVQP